MAKSEVVRKNANRVIRRLRVKVHCNIYQIKRFNTQKIKVFIDNFKCDQIRRKPSIWSALMERFFEWCSGEL